MPASARAVPPCPRCQPDSRQHPASLRDTSPHARSPRQRPDHRPVRRLHQFPGLRQHPRRPARAPYRRTGDHHYRPKPGIQTAVSAVILPVTPALPLRSRTGSFWCGLLPSPGGQRNQFGGIGGRGSRWATARRCPRAVPKRLRTMMISFFSLADIPTDSFAAISDSFYSACGCDRCNNNAMPYGMHLPG